MRITILATAAVTILGALVLSWTGNPVDASSKGEVGNAQTQIDLFAITQSARELPVEQYDAI